MIEYVRIDDAIASEGRKFDEAVLTLSLSKVTFSEVMEELKVEAKMVDSFAEAGRKSYSGFMYEAPKGGRMTTEGRRMAKAYMLQKMKKYGLDEVSSYTLESLDACICRLEKMQQEGPLGAAEVDYMAHGLANFERRLHTEDVDFASELPRVGSLVRLREETSQKLGPGYVHWVEGGNAQVRFPSNNFWDAVEVPIENLVEVDWTGEKESLSKAKDELSESRKTLAQYQAEMVNLARDIGLDPDVAVANPEYYGDMISEAVENLKAENAQLKEQLSGHKAAGKVPSRECRAKTPESQEMKAREAAVRPEGFDVKVGKVHWR